MPVVISFYLKHLLGYIEHIELLKRLDKDVNVCVLEQLWFVAAFFTPNTTSYFLSYISYIDI